MSASRVILASTSKYRAGLLQRIVPDFEQVAPEVDESAERGEAPEALARRLALAKALAVAGPRSEGIVIGSDQVAAIGSRVFGKPGDAARAAEALGFASGKELSFYTAVVVVDARTMDTRATLDVTRARFRELDRATIERYLALDEPYDCAGAIRTEAHGSLLLESLENRDPSAIIGLPLIETSAMLRAFGVDPLAA